MNSRLWFCRVSVFVPFRQEALVSAALFRLLEAFLMKSVAWILVFHVFLSFLVPCILNCDPVLPLARGWRVSGVCVLSFEWNCCGVSTQLVGRCRLYMPVGSDDPSSSSWICLLVFCSRLPWSGSSFLLLWRLSVFFKC
jgi:hypothetical protein